MVSRDRLNVVINFILFQAIWFAAILGAANDNMIWCHGLFVVLLVWQFWPSNRKPGDCMYVIILMLVGGLIDTLWIYSGLIEYQYHVSWFNTAPTWILILWVAFALSLNHSMSWMFKHPKKAFIFGAFGGPISYFAGERLGAITINQPLLTTVCLAMAWVLVISLVLRLNQSKHSNLFGLFLGSKENV